MNDNKRIASLNDALRKSIGDGNINQTDGNNRIILTSGVYALPFRQAVLKQVRDFEIDYDFNENNDPYQEHDMGSFHVNNIKFFWKIDYYDNSMKHGSEDPSNAEITTRVLTIMKAEEY